MTACVYREGCRSPMLCDRAGFCITPPLPEPAPAEGQAEITDDGVRNLIEMNRAAGRFQNVYALESLLRQIGRLRQEVARHKGVADWCTDQYDTDAREKLALTAQVAQMRAALEPFADVDGEGDEDLPDETNVVVKFGRSTFYALRLGDLRKARAALSALPQREALVVRCLNCGRTDAVPAGATWQCGSCSCSDRFEVVGPQREAERISGPGISPGPAPAQAREGGDG